MIRKRIGSLFIVLFFVLLASVRADAEPAASRR